MKLIEIQSLAERVAGLLLRGANEEYEGGSLDAEIKEILLFGSAARHEDEPGDIDLMLLDGGYYSRYFCASKPRRSSGMYLHLRENFVELVEQWFVYGEDDQANEIAFEMLLSGVKVDLHILPVLMLINPGIYELLAEQHKDPQFFSKAFSAIERFDETTGHFVPTTLSDLRMKYTSQPGPLADPRV